MRRHARVIDHHARRLGLAPRHSLHECLSTLAQISQTPPSLDFPRAALPGCFHAVGPLRDESPGSDQEAPATIPPRPFVFASLGTLQGHRYALFRNIAKACQRLEMPLLIAHCGGLDAAQAARLERYGTTWVTDFADQRAVLSSARAVITHGGLNTVVDAIHSATPMLVVPLAFDQPGVAARIVHHGIGQSASRFVGSATLAKRLSGLLNNDIYRLRLRAMHATLTQAGGAVKAARIAEQALSERRPVLAEAA